MAENTENSRKDRQGAKKTMPFPLRLGGLSVSQAVFAKIMGASVDLVAAWEQGNRVPKPMACRLLESIERDRNRWLEILEQSLAEASAGRP